ncbi:MAG: chromophore lyase CpcT/CpeT [Bacteroidetes bacterium]|nr:chromophore lyase CpcT/CpeT [Bacteroidota bacterium]
MKFSKLQDRSFLNEVSSPSPFRYECRGLLWMPCLLILWLLGHQAQAIAPFNARLENPPSAGKAAKPRYSKDLLLLTQWFIGDFDNTKQCRVDTGAQPVESHVVKIWDNYFTDAVWIYEEFQSPPGQVTSQRIYKFMDYTAGRFESKVYTLENFSELAGEYKNLRPFEQFTPENLEDHPYCVVYWTRKGETRFTGSTVGTDCHLLRGRHKYVTNQIDVYPTRVSRIHRVFGWENEQVSGPKADEKGSELRRIVPPKPKKVKPVKKPTAKKGAKSSSAKKASAKKGSNAKGKGKKSKTQETTPEENPETLNPALEETSDAPAPKKSFWDRFKRKKPQETETEEEPKGE